jgi:hypothetical protein
LSEGARPPGSAPVGATRDYRAADGTMSIELRTSQLVVTRATGVARQAMIEHYLHHFLPFAASATRKIDVFHDWSDVTSFEPGARQAFMKWAEERRELNRKLMRGVHILAGSTMVFLALGAARVLYGAQLDVYRTREAWLEALRAAERAPSSEPVR